MHKRRPYTLLWLLSALPLAGCAMSGPQSIFDTAGPVARDQANLFIYISWLALPVFLVVAGALIYTLVKYRRRGDEEGMPDQIHGVLWLEALWTAAPVLILIAIGIPTVRMIFEQESRVEPTGEDLVVNVIGYQWWWAFEYPELGITTANELHIPTGRRVVLNLNSGDVLHSFWVPRLAGKRDLIPNQNNQLWFMADEPGMYYGQCAELCLGAHAYMRFRVIASEDAEFAAWAATFEPSAAREVQAAAPQITRGAELFKTKGCAACHAIQGVSSGSTGAGPNLTNFGLRHTVAAGVLENTPENLAAWLRDPQKVKPTNYMPTLWTEDDPNREDEINALVAYLHSLGVDEPERTATVSGRR